MNRGTNRPPAHDFTFIIEMLKEKPMTWNEIEKEFFKRNDPVTRTAIIQYLSVNTALYETESGQYKILTEEDLEKYERKSL